MNTKPVPVAIATETIGDYVYEITQHGPNSYDVDCWNADGSNHWNLWFNSEVKARAEYHRWVKLTS